MAAKEYSLKKRGTMFFVIKELQKYYGTRRIEKVVEIGGGLGTNLAFIKRLLNVGEMISTDVFVPEQKIEGVTYLELPVERLSAGFAKETVDLVLMIEVMEHLFDPDATIMQVRKILKQDGILLITTPNLSSLINRVALLFGLLPMGVEVSTRRVFGRPIFLGGLRASCVGHIRVFTFNSLIQFLSYYGFKVIRAYTVPHLFTSVDKAGNPGDPKGIERLLRLVEKFSVSLNHTLGFDIVILAKKSSGLTLYLRDCK